MTNLEILLSVSLLLGFLYIVLQHHLIKQMEDLEKAYERYTKQLQDNNAKIRKLSAMRETLTSKHINILKKDRSTLEWRLGLFESKMDAQRANIKRLTASKATLELKVEHNLKTIKKERESVKHMWSVVIANCVEMDKMKNRLRPIEDVDRALEWWKDAYHAKAKELTALERKTSMRRKSSDLDIL